MHVTEDRESAPAFLALQAAGTEVFPGPTQIRLLKKRADKAAAASAAAAAAGSAEHPEEWSLEEQLAKLRIASVDPLPLPAANLAEDGKSAADNEIDRTKKKKKKMKGKKKR